MQPSTSTDQLQDMIVPIDPTRKVSPHWTIKRKRRQVRNAAMIMAACMLLAVALATAIYQLT